jgi:hypothetical protein
MSWNSGSERPSSPRRSTTTRGCGPRQRRRTFADARNWSVANAHKFGVESFASALLPVKDSLEAALAAQNNTVESIRSGVELTLKQLSAAFDKFSLCEINPRRARNSTRIVIKP